VVVFIEVITLPVTRSKNAQDWGLLALLLAALLGKSKHGGRKIFGHFCETVEHQ
jgi:hypothetical protein